MHDTTRPSSTRRGRRPRRLVTALFAALLASPAFLADAQPAAASGSASCSVTVVRQGGTAGGYASGRCRGMAQVRIRAHCPGVAPDRYSGWVTLRPGRTVQIYTAPCGYFTMPNRASYQVR